MQKMETTVAKEGVHTVQQQHCANNGEFCIFRAVVAATLWAERGLR